MSKRRAVLAVEYSLRGTAGGKPPTPEKWERVFGGSHLANLRVEVLEDEVTPR